MIAALTALLPVYWPDEGPHFTLGLTEFLVTHWMSMAEGS